MLIASFFLAFLIWSSASFAGSCSAPLPPDQEIPYADGLDPFLFEGILWLLGGGILLLIFFIRKRRAKNKKLK
jgi:hypothetical protein